MMKPKLLLLDEPSLGLAPLIVKSIFETVRKIADEGVTVLMVEQNARQSLRIADMPTFWNWAPSSPRALLRNFCRMRN